MPWTRNTLWRQGSVLAQEDFQAAGLIDETGASIAVAISHDCDIANDLDAEPAVEFIFARIVEEQNGNFKLGKNPRTLHLSYAHEGKPIFLEMIASQKTTVSKDILVNIKPSPSHKLVTPYYVLQSWLAARYRRHALPNSLVDRLKPVFAHIEKEGKNNADGILSFQLSYDPMSELPPKEPYELWLKIVYVTDDARYKFIAEQMAKSIEAKFSKLLEKTNNFGSVDLRECVARSDMEFTMRDALDTQEYHLEYVSYRTDPPGPIA